jgi:hypothetical protein
MQTSQHRTPKIVDSVKMQVNRYVHPSLIIPATVSQPDLQKMLAQSSPEVYDSSITQFIKDFDSFVTNNLASLDRPTRFNQSYFRDEDTEDDRAAEMFCNDMKALRQIAIDALKSYL